ncbi:MAG: 30S ribosomal protein S20 [Actinomycetota bacterium]
MANIKSQIKRNRQNEAARKRNKAERSALKTQIKKFLGAAQSGDDSAKELYVDVSKSLDKAAAKGIIHKNKAANQKARLAKKLG